MKPLLFVVNEHDENTVVIDKHRLEQMLKLTYDEGYNDGKQKIQYVPPTYRATDNSIEVTCENKNDVTITGGNQDERNFKI